MSAPRSKSIFPGAAKFGSAIRSEICVHLEVPYTGCRGRIQVTHGTTTAVIEYLELGKLREDISKFEIEVIGDFCEMPPIPDTVTPYGHHFNPRD